MRKFNISFFYVFLIVVLTNGIRISASDAFPEIEALFTSNVHISDYSVAEYQEQQPENGIFYDNETRLLYIDESHFPYPSEILSISGIRINEDNRLMLGVSEPLPDTATATHRSPRTWLWFFNSTTGDFSRFNPLCGEPRDFSFRDFDTPWIYVTDSHTNQVHLCDPTTGRESQVLPEELSWEIMPTFSDGNLPVFHSPDGEWLLIFGELDGRSYAFSYQIRLNHLISLGSFPCHICLEFGTIRWFDTTVNIWTYANDEHKIYSANVTEVDGLDLAITRPLYFPSFYDNPPRYDYVNFTMPENIWETQCQRVVYNILSQEIQITEMGFLCRPEWGSLDSIGYYRDVSQGSQGIAVLTRFDAVTGQTEALFEGEIEGIEWISPDAQFAVLVLDNNGYIDTPPFRSPLSWALPSNSVLALVNLVNKEVLVEIKTSWNGCDESYGGPDFSWSMGLSVSSLMPCSNIGPRGAIFQRDDGSILAVGDINDARLLIPNNQFADLITLDDGDTISSRLLEGDLTPFNANYFLVENRDSTNETVKFSYFSVNERELIDITHAISSADYYVRITDIYPNSNELRIMFRPETGANLSWYNAHITIEIESP